MIKNKNHLIDFEKDRLNSQIADIIEDVDAIKAIPLFLPNYLCIIDHCLIAITILERIRNLEEHIKKALEVKKE